MWTLRPGLLLLARLVYTVNDTFCYAEVCDPRCDQTLLEDP